MQDNVEFIDNYSPTRIYKDLLTSDCCGLSILALRKSSDLRSCSDIFSEDSGRFLRNLHIQYLYDWWYWFFLTTNR